MHYVLDDENEIHEVADLREWAEFFEKCNRHVADERVGEVRISTVFLGIDHNFGGGGPPVLFETMVFGGELDGEQARCCAYAEAEEMHAAMVARVRACQAAGTCP